MFLQLLTRRGPDREGFGNLSGRSEKIKTFLPLGVIFMSFLFNGGISPQGLGGFLGTKPLCFAGGGSEGRDRAKERRRPDRAKASRESAPGFRVTTILVSGRTKVAGINGVLRQKGDEVNGYRIAEIEEKQVTLVRGKDKRVLKIDPETGYFFKKIKSNNKLLGFSK